MKRFEESPRICSGIIGKQHVRYLVPEIGRSFVQYDCNAYVRLTPDQPSDFLPGSICSIISAEKVKDTSHVGYSLTHGGLPEHNGIQWDALKEGEGGLSFEQEKDTLLYRGYYKIRFFQR